MHRTAGNCYKQSIPAKNSTARDSSYINEDFRLRIRFVETRLGGFEKKKGGKWGRGENCSEN